MSFSFSAAFYQGQSIVETCTLLGFSLLGPCFASLHLPLAALGFAPFHEKKKRQKKRSHRLFDCRQMFCFSAAAMSSSR